MFYAWCVLFVIVYFMVHLIRRVNFRGTLIFWTNNFSIKALILFKYVNSFHDFPVLTVFKHLQGDHLIKHGAHRFWCLWSMLFWCYNMCILFCIILAMSLTILMKGFFQTGLCFWVIGGYSSAYVLNFWFAVCSLRGAEVAFSLTIQKANVQSYLLTRFIFS